MFLKGIQQCEVTMATMSIGSLVIWSNTNVLW